MSDFPLYDQLAADLPRRDLTISQKRSFLKKMTGINQGGFDMLYVLIRWHYNQSNELSFDLPYEGNSTDDGIVFDLENLPRELRHILYRFLTAHLKRMEEDEQLEQERVELMG